jgi:AcrR family transcriptional regulator
MKTETVRSQSQETIKSIVHAATTHFAEKGYHGARIDEIAQFAGVNKAAIYYHVGDKAHLYARVIENVLGNIATQVTENIKGASTNRERLRAFITTLARNIGEDPFFAPLMMRVTASGGANLPDSVMLQMLKLFGALFCILDEGKTDEQFAAVNPMVVHMMIVGGLTFYIAGAPVRDRVRSLGEAEFQRDLDVSFDQAANDIAELIVKAVANK